MKKRINIEEAVRLYREGLSVRAVAAAIGCSPGGLLLALHRCGYASMIRPRGHAAPPFDVAEAAGLYRAGRITKDLAAKYGVSVATFLKRLKSFGVKIRKGGAAQKMSYAKRAHRMIAMRQVGIPYSDIARAYRVSRQRVQQITKEAQCATSPSPTA